jgi:hypothetical protein
MLDPPPPPDGWMADGHWVETLHGLGWSVLGVWEIRHDPLLLRVRPLWITQEQVAYQHLQRQQIEGQLTEWRTTAGDTPLDLSWTLSYQPLQDAPSSYWCTPGDLQALVGFLAEWLGEDATFPAQPSPLHFRLMTNPWSDESSDSDDLLEFDEPEPWVEVPVEEPPEDTTPWPRDEDRWEPDIPAAALPGEEPDWEFVDPPELSQEVGEPLPPWTWDPEELYFSVPAYTYIPSPDLPGASELYTLVGMPTWQRAREAEPWQRRTRIRREPQLGMVEVDLFSVVSYRLEDLRDPNFDPYIEPGVGYIELDRSALQELLALLQQQIDQFLLARLSEARTDSEEGNR